MTRRLEEPLNNSRYCVDVKKREIHDLDNEKLLCQIDSVIKEGNVRPYLDIISAHMEGFVDCRCCIGILKEFCRDASKVESRNMACENR